MNRSVLGGLVALAALALAAPVSASTPTSPAGTVYTGPVKAQSAAQHVLIHTKGGTTITCETSSFDWEIESHGPSETTKGSVTNLSFGSCGTTTVSVLKKGTVEVHKGPEGSSYETVTWSGMEITVAAPFTPDCKYFFQQPTSIFMGGLTASSVLGTTAAFDFETNKIPVGNSILCPEWIQFTGAYTITTPDRLDFD